jgi:hypothetical protein
MAIVNPEVFGGRRRPSISTLVAGTYWAMKSGPIINKEKKKIERGPGGLNGPFGPFRSGRLAGSFSIFLFSFLFFYFYFF